MMRKALVSFEYFQLQNGEEMHVSPTYEYEGKQILGRDYRTQLWTFDGVTKQINKSHFLNTCVFRFSYDLFLSIYNKMRDCCQLLLLTATFYA